MRHIIFVSVIMVAAFTYASGHVREPPLEKGQIDTASQEFEPPLEQGTIEDLKGVTKVYVDAPDHYSSLFLREIVENWGCSQSRLQSMTGSSG